MKIESVLIVDDEPAVLRMLKMALTRQGCSHVDTAGEGEEALRKISRESYDLVITDIQMPGYSGNEILFHVRQKSPMIPVVGMSGTPWLLEEGFDAVICKPCTMPELTEAVRVAVSRKFGADCVSGAGSSGTVGSKAEGMK